MLSLTALAVLGFAGYRATRVVTGDSITDPLRERLIDWHGAKPESTAREAVLTLATCTYCAGWWLSGLVLAAYLLASGAWHTAPVLVHGVEWLGVAGVQALLSRAETALDERAG
ncbi:DUF1360 domain-containing protein [Streptomyces chilikensis]|uniref:DUF1360 domain-containing protein n=1 Tax=Streptomyces chilikensis TaxID=1194079 RepID=A0ABV3EJ81_9ACTN